MNKYQKKKMKKSGFTLLELLIVIGLIATLMTLSVVVMSGFLTTAEVEATSATIQKTFRLLEQRTDAFDRSFKGSRKQLEISRIRFLLARQELFGVSEESIEILAKKAAYRFEFPQRMVERTTIGEDINSNGILDSGEDINSNGVLDGLDNVPNGAAYPNLAVGQTASVPGMPFSIYDKIAYPIALQQLIKEGNATPTSDLVNARVTLNWSRHQTATESAELLYYTLVYSTSYGSAAVDSDRFTNAEVRDTDGDGLPEFVDAWEQPLRCYRWPTRLIDTHPPVPFQPVLSDPNDATDVIITVDTNNDGVPDTTVGQRQVAALERQVASIMLKGLPPASALLPNGALPRDLLLTDPDDPVGILYFELERLNGLNGTPLFSNEFNETKYHTPDTFHSPLIVSAGKDGQLGLYEPNDSANFGNLAQYNDDLNGNGTAREAADLALMQDVIADNVTNRNKRAGGR